MTSPFPGRTATCCAAACVWALLQLFPSAPVVAQGWPSWADGVFGIRPERRYRPPEPRRSYPPPRQRYRYVAPWEWDEAPPPWERRAEPQRPPGGEPVRSGGPRPAIASAAPPIVRFTEATYAPGEIVIDQRERRLYFVLPDERAYAYDIGVGREGFAWTGSETISRKQAWPDWHPPAEMKQRDPRLPDRMTGGIRNPLGAMALYLGSTLYRIHGTNEPKSIGRAQSSGCFRMMNENVMHLASLADIGTRVTVVEALPVEAVSRERVDPPWPVRRAAVGGPVPPAPAIRP